MRILEAEKETRVSVRYLAANRRTGNVLLHHGQFVMSTDLQALDAMVVLLGYELDDVSVKITEWGSHDGRDHAQREGR